MSKNALFDGVTHVPERDERHFSSQLDAVKSIVLGGGWHTLAEFVYRLAHEYRITASEASVSARLRDLRKVRFGSYNIEHRVRAHTRRTHEYHLGSTAGRAKDKARSEQAGSLA